MWVIFGPTFAWSLVVFVQCLVESRGIAWQPDPLSNAGLALLMLGITGGAAAVCGTLLYKTTRNYLRLRQVRKEEDVEENDAAEEDGNRDG